jgi:integrase
MAERIILQHQSASTKAAYDRAVADYEAHRNELPHSEAVLLSYLTQQSETKASSTLWTLFSLVKKYMLLECSCDVGRSPRVVDFLKTLSRFHKPKKALALSRDEIFRFLRESSSKDNGLVDKLILLAGYYGGLRGCELVALTWEDLTFAHEGILLRIGQSKTDRAGIGSVKLLPKLDEDFICPVYYFTLYKSLVSATTGRLFCQFRHGKVTKMPYGKTKVSEVPKAVASFLGLPSPSAYTGHALRVSSATTLADDGATTLCLKRHGRWKSESVAEGYLRESKAVRLETAGILSGKSLASSSTGQKAANNEQSNSLFSNCVFNGTVILQQGTDDSTARAIKE